MLSHSTNVAHGQATEESLKERLRLSQEWLWEQYDWEHLDVSRDIQLLAGQRFYDVPSDLIAERIHSFSFKYSNEWIPVEYGINPEDFTVYDSDADVRSWPIYKWNFSEDTEASDPYGKIEVWPIPSQSGDPSSKLGYIRLQGIRSLGQLIGDSDKCTLDANLIVYQAAIPMVARQNQKDAERLAAEQEKLRLRLQGNGSRGRFSFNEDELVKASDYRFAFVRK